MVQQTQTRTQKKQQQQQKATLYQQKVPFYKKYWKQMLFTAFCLCVISLLTFLSSFRHTRTYSSSSSSGPISSEEATVTETECSSHPDPNDPSKLLYDCHVKVSYTKNGTTYEKEYTEENLSNSYNPGETINIKVDINNNVVTTTSQDPISITFPPSKWGSFNWSRPTMAPWSFSSR